MAKKKDINQMKVATGELPTRKPKTINEFFGFKDSRYSTIKEDEYLAQVNGMNLSDLIAHSVRLGIPPYKERDRLTKKLMNEFRAWASSYNRPDNTFEYRNDPKNIPESVRKFAAEGR